MGKECGFVICRDRSGRHHRGPVSCGTSTKVNIPVRCPEGTKPVAVYHSHPGPGDRARLSDADVRNLRKAGIPYGCVSDDKGNLRCYRVGKNRR